jgi:hypothetical protein
MQVERDARGCRWNPSRSNPSRSTFYGRVSGSLKRRYGGRRRCAGSAHPSISSSLNQLKQLIRQAKLRWDQKGN